MLAWLDGINPRIFFFPDFLEQASPLLLLLMATRQFQSLTPVPPSCSPPFDFPSVDPFLCWQNQFPNGYTPVYTPEIVGLVSHRLHGLYHLHMVRFALNLKVHL